MGYFNRDSSSGGNRNFGKRGFGDRSDRQMHRATCSNCGKECQVPFKPTGGKPVFCSECFEKKGGSSDSKRFGDKNNQQPQNNAQLEAINSKLDKILAILGPISVKPAEELKVVVKKKTKTTKKTTPTPEE